MKKIVLPLMLLAGCVFLQNMTFASDLNDELSKFQSADWKSVKAAKVNLENQEALVIPELMKLFESTKKVKLENTGSLIYPGAEKFFGHGQILDYDIDYLSVRAGWLLEELTFNNFGFSGVHLPADLIKNHIKLRFPEYYNNSANRKRIDSSSDEELREIVLGLSIKKAKEWWRAQNDWTRLEALVKALQSFDEKRQVMALFYIRNGTTKCTGLNKEYYINQMAKEIVRLSSSEIQRIAEHAQQVLMDTKYYWLSIKPE